MKSKQLHTMLLVPLCAALAACSEQDVLVEETIDGKSPIVLSVGGVDSPEPTTRAVITDGTGKTLEPFDVDAKIFMVMRSDYGPDDYKGEHTTKYNVARGDVAVSKNDNTNKRSIVDFDVMNQRYWDDAHARSSKLSIWGYALRGQSVNSCNFNGTTYDTADDAEQPYAWTTSEVVPILLNWRASNASGSEVQDASSLQAQDLLYTNNLANNGVDNRLGFNFTTRKFPQVGEANMIFYHAMSKITIKIVEGDGFDKSATTDFQFTTTGGNVILKGFNHTGTFDIKQGEFTSIPTSGTSDIPSISLKSTTPSASEYYTLEALVVPSIASDGASRFVVEKKNLATDVMMEFAIDNNLYQITHDDLYEALKGQSGATMKTDNGNYIPLEAGKNYVFTFTIGKTKIKNLTAQVAEWETVNADVQNPTNARIKLQLEERGEPQTSNVAFYKKDDNKTTDGIDDNYATYNWDSGYTNLGATYSSNHWTTSSFWQSSKDFYHFRALMPATTSVTNDGTHDVAALTSATAYTDVRWGAPMKDDGINEDPGDFKWTYDPENNGFDNAAHTQINQAIGATEDPVKLVLFHMMSDLTFNIKTTTGDDKVKLVDGANKTKVEIVGFYPAGKVLLGTGLVKTTGATTDTKEVAWNSENAGTHVYKYGVVPQNLTHVQLRITTPDNNQYIVDLKDVKASTIVTDNITNPYTLSDGKYKIGRWYPGFQYVYSFTLKKTGITNLTATVVKWETVTAVDEVVVIK